MSHDDEDDLGVDLSVREPGTIYHIEVYKQPSKDALDQRPRLSDSIKPEPETDLAMAVQKGKFFCKYRHFFRIIEEKGSGAGRLKQCVYDSRTPDPKVKQLVKTLWEDAEDMVEYREKKREDAARRRVQSYYQSEPLT